MLEVTPRLALIVALVLPGAALAYPGGTPSYVTDVAPFCAGCHSSVSEAQLAGVAPKRVQAEQVANKHLAKIRQAGADSPYAKLSDQQRDELIAGIQAIDAASSVKVMAPATLQPGAVFEVTIEATGGGGPVVGLALVDSAQRWQARPASSAGWHVIDKPRVQGPGGKDQTDFTDRRNPALAPGISYVNVYGVKTDTAAGKYSRVRVTLRVRAPAQPGSYPLAAVMLYGTEKGSPHGAVETIHGVVPLGGFSANSGRVRFSEVVQVVVGAPTGGE